MQFAEWMDRARPLKSGVLVFDYPGALAYYSSQRIVAQDGLVGDYRYDAEVRAGRLARYLSDHSIEYYLAPIDTPADSCIMATVFAPISRADGGSLLLCARDLLGTTESVVAGVPAPFVGLYRIKEVLPPGRKIPPRVIKHGALW
jgi:hypothetical protein